jgi:sialidase-1
MHRVLGRCAALVGAMIMGMGVIGDALAVGAPKPETLLVIEPTKQFPRNSEGDVVELKDGRLMLIYTRFTGGGADNSKADLCARVSADGGKTWSGDRVLVPNEGRENIMSVSIVRLKTGELLLFYLRKNGWNDCQLLVRRSSDEFATLGEPVRATVADGYHVVNNDRVLALKDGRLVVPAALHPCPDGTRKTWTSLGVPRAFLSDDGGRTWHGDKTVVSPPPKRKVTLQEPGVVELRDGRLWMWCRTTSGCQYACMSSDRGETWSEPAPTNIKSPCSPATIERVPWTGDLLMVFNDHSGAHPYPKGRRTPLCVALSKDDGKTWSPSRVIESDPDGWYCYTAMAFVGDRAILAYCAGDKKVGGLNRLKVLALPRAWLYPQK